MLRSPWLALVVGVMVGLAVGYALAERQPVPPARAVAAAHAGGAGAGPGMPGGHPPVAQSGTAGPSVAEQRERLERLEQMHEQRPDDPRPMVALGDLYFDLGRWESARSWYERALPLDGDNPDLLTDLAVVFRNLRQPERGLELLDRASKVKPDHWQSWYNRVVILHYDLHRHDEAAAALERLRALAAAGVQVPDLRGLERDVRGG